MGIRNLFNWKSLQKKEESVFGATDVGQARDNNEDAFLLMPEKHIYIVSDGMGGHNAGEIASGEAVKTLERIMSAQNFGGMTQEEIKKNISESVISAHNAVYDLSRTNPQYSQMGCTLVVALIKDRVLHTCHVGDSRAYVINQNEIIQVTADHSVVMEMVKSGSMTKEEARASHLKNQLTQAVGLAYSINPENSYYELNEADTLLLCTDGLWDMLSDEEIRNAVNEGGTAEEICKRLIKESVAQIFFK